MRNNARPRDSRSHSTGLSSSFIASRNMQGLSHYIVLSVLWIYFLFAFLIPKVSTGTFNFLIIMGLVAFMLQPKAQRWMDVAFMKKYWPLHCSMLAMLLAVLASQIGNGAFQFGPYKFPLRLAAFPIILWLLLQVRYERLLQLKWAFVAIAITGAIKTYIVTDGGVYREHPNFMPLIAYTQLVMLAGAVAVLSIGWQKSSRAWPGWLESGIKVIAGCCGLLAPYLYQTRGSSFAIPVFILLICFALLRRVSLKKQLFTASAIIVAVTAILASTATVQSRMNDFISDMEQYETGQSRDTATGIRLQLWKGSWTMFKEHPLVGVSHQHYGQAMEDMHKRGIVSELSATFPHSHNELLFTMATTGTIGLISLLLLYLGPAVFFAMHFRSPDKEIRTACAMGLTLCLGYVAYGLVDVMFLWKEPAVFYTVSAALFCAIIMKRRAMPDTGEPGIDYRKATALKSKPEPRA